MGSKLDSKNEVKKKNCKDFLEESMKQIIKGLNYQENKKKMEEFENGYKS